MFKRSLLVVAFAFWMVSVVSAADVSVSEQTFGCVLDWPQVRDDDRVPGRERRRQRRPHDDG